MSAGTFPEFRPGTLTLPDGATLCFEGSIIADPDMAIFAADMRRMVEGLS